MTSQATLARHTTGRITRTANEYSTSYQTTVPSDVFDVQNFMGAVRFALATDNGIPKLTVTPDVEDSGRATDILVANGESLPLPRDVIEYALPIELSNWNQTDDGFSATIALPSLSGDPITTATQPLRTTGTQTFLTLPKVEPIVEKQACTLQLTHNGDEYVLAVTAVSPRADATPIIDPHALPQVELPSGIVDALTLSDGDSIPVEVYNESPARYRDSVVESYEAEYDSTPPTDITQTETAYELTLPQSLADELDALGFTSAPLNVTGDRGTPLLIFDTWGSEGAVSATRDGQTLSIPREVGDLLDIESATLYWHLYDGKPVAEAVGERPLPPQSGQKLVGPVEEGGHRLGVPPEIDDALSNPEEVRFTITWDDTEPVLFVGRERGCAAPVDRSGPGVEFGADETIASLLDLQADDTAIIWTLTEAGLFGTPRARDVASAEAQIGDEDYELGQEFNANELYIPVDGRDALVRNMGESNPAVALPKDATSQFDLSEGDKFSIRVGVYGQHLALTATPITDAETGPDVCLGRMLSQTNMRLPVQLVATLSLFERTMTWGISWGREGAKLVALLEPFGAPPLTDGFPVGEGRVYEETKNERATHYDVTIPKEAFDVYDEHPPGVFVSYDVIDGDGRIMLLPVGEEDIDIAGVVRLREKWGSGTYAVTLPKSMASAMAMREDEPVSWTFLDGQFVGSLSTSQSLE